MDVYNMLNKTVARFPENSLLQVKTIAFFLCLIIMFWLFKTLYSRETVSESTEFGLGNVWCPFANQLAFYKGTFLIKFMVYSVWRQYWKENPGEAALIHEFPQMHAYLHHIICFIETPFWSQGSRRMCQVIKKKSKWMARWLSWLRYRSFHSTKRQTLTAGEVPHTDKCTHWWDGTIAQNIFLMIIWRYYFFETVSY